MVSNARELFRHGLGDETFAPEMAIISMLVKLDTIGGSFLISPRLWGEVGFAQWRETG
jgi:hypothetical protein